MTKEVKTESKETTKIYWGIAAVAAVLALFVIFKPESDKTANEATKSATTQAVAPKDEKTIARIDISTKLVDADKPQFEVYVDGAKTPLKEQKWLNSYNTQGTVVEKDGKEVSFVVKILKDIDFKFVLRGHIPNIVDGVRIPEWVDYTSIIIDGQEMLKGRTPIWHDKPMYYNFHGEAGKVYNVHVKWEKHIDE